MFNTVKSSALYNLDFYLLFNPLVLNSFLEEIKIQGNSELARGMTLAINTRPRPKTRPMLGLHRRSQVFWPFQRPEQSWPLMSPFPQIPPKLEVGDILSGFVEVWSQSEQNSGFSQITGLSIPFISSPPLSRSPLALTAYSLGSEKFTVIKKKKKNHCWGF